MQPLTYKTCHVYKEVTKLCKKMFCLILYLLIFARLDTFKRLYQMQKILKGRIKQHSPSPFWKIIKHTTSPAWSRNKLSFLLHYFHTTNNTLYKAGTRAVFINYALPTANIYNSLWLMSAILLNCWHHTFTRKQSRNFSRLTCMYSKYLQKN